MRLLGNIQNSVDAGMFFLGNWVLYEEMDGGTKLWSLVLCKVLLEWIGYTNLTTTFSDSN